MTRTEETSSRTAAAGEPGIPGSLEEIEARINELRAEMENVRGTEAEVYTRIVGYYRPVRNWNHGKSQEYRERIVFNSPGENPGRERSAEAGSTPADTAAAPADTAPAPEAAPAHEAAPATGSSIPGDLGLTAGADEAVQYIFFYRTTCPNCPPVHSYLEEELPSYVKGRAINVDEQGGDVEAMTYQVYSAPTVIFFNSDNAEIFRAHNAEILEEFFEEAASSPAAANA